MSTLGVAVVGLGVGEQHARSFATDGRATVRWLYDLDAAKAELLARELGAQVAPSFDAILADRSIDAVSIASYDDHHAGQVEAAFSAGKHVFVEKPLCRTRRELGAIATAWSARRVHLTSNLVLRGAPLYRWLREAIAAGELGEIYAFDGDYLYGRAHKITEGWRKDVDDYSVMLGGGVHLVDLMIGLTGELPSTVVTHGNHIATRQTAFRYCDYQSAVFTFPSGIVARITANFGCMHRHQHVVRVFGTKATFLYDDCGPRLHSSRRPDQAPAPIALAALPPGKGVLVPDFIGAIVNGEDPAPAARREFALMSACEASDHSLLSGSAQPVHYVTH